MILRCTIIFFLSLCFSAQSFASAYVGTQDKQLHYDLQTLVEWGYLDLAVNTYPVPWRGISSALDNLNPAEMDFRPQQAYLRLKHYFSLHKQQQSRRFITLQGASDDIRFRSFDDGVEETGKLSVSSEFYAGRWSGQITANYASGGRKNFDNTFIAYQIGEWNFRLGSLDQWWGPAQSSSLLLSNNTRPVKALALSRSTSTASTSPWLSWMGPWYFTTQLGQMESGRTVGEPLLLMNRFNFRPIKGLEIGLSYTGMFGGEGQNEGFSEFIEFITFESVCLREDDDCTSEQLSKRGNLLAGFDISYTAQILDRPVTFYVQRVGEDSKKGARVTDNANLFGISTYFKGAKIFLETSDTNVSCGDNELAFDCYYEHGTYVDGYRMYGRAIGSTFDSDAKQITLGTNFRFAGGEIMEVYLRSAELNADESRPSPVLTLADSEDLIELSGFYQKPLGNWLLKAGGSLANRRFEGIDNETDALIYVKAQLAF